MKKLLTATSVTVLLMTAPVWAQTASGSGAASTSTVRPQTSFSQQDEQFMRQAAPANLAEIEEGKLAVKKSASPAIQVFGRWMATDHTFAGNLLASIAKQGGAELPTTPDSEQQAKIEKLQGLSGVEFDQAYLQTEVEDHQKTIALFEQEAQSGQQPELKAFAEQLTPVLEQHLAAAQQLQTMSTMASGSSVPPSQSK
jgi:putative membrane protein